MLREATPILIYKGISFTLQQLLGWRLTDVVVSDLQSYSLYSIYLFILLFPIACNDIRAVFTEQVGQW